MSRKSTTRATKPAGSSRGFDKELAELEALAEELRPNPKPDAAQTERLRKTLDHRNNFLVSKAAKLIAHCELTALLPDVLSAYNRFFIDAESSDPKCWAKEALAKALVKLGHRAKDEYLRGMRHHQMEASWGPPVDTAGALRGTCAHALVDCPGLSDAELLTVLLEPLTDVDKTVRMEAARAIGQVGGVSAALLLRLRALLANDEPEVLGAVYSALLSLDGALAVPLVAEVLETGDDLAAEAAYALAELRTADALKALIARLGKGCDAWFGSVLLGAIALTRMPEALGFLLGMIAREEIHAKAAIEAIARTAPNAELRARVVQAVKEADNPRLRKALLEHLPELPE